MSSTKFNNINNRIAYLNPVPIFSDDFLFLKYCSTSIGVWWYLFIHWRYNYWFWIIPSSVDSDSILSEIQKYLKYSTSLRMFNSIILALSLFLPITSLLNTSHVPFLQIFSFSTKSALKILFHLHKNSNFLFK